LAENKVDGLVADIGVRGLQATRIGVVDGREPGAGGEIG
jgi:hypothetical protein